MIPLTQNDLQILIAAAVFILGCLSMIIGIFVIVTRGPSREMKALAAHASRMAKKGLSEELTSLVTSASDLVVALNQLARTASGVGIFLVSFGLTLVVASYWVIQQIQWAAS